MPPRDDDERSEPIGYGINVFVRCNALDDGKRPLPIGTDFYFSPAITYQPSDPLGRVQPGQAISVSASLENNGLQTAQFVKVEFSFAAPAPGGGMKRTVIGTATQVVVPGQGSETATCPVPWIPTLEDSAHQCLFVRCTVPGQPNSADATSPYAPDQSPWAGQHNVTVLDPQMVRNTQSMLLRLPNPFGEPRRMRVHLATNLVRMDQTVLTELPPAAIHDLLGLLTAPRPARLPTALLERLSVERADRADFGIRGVEFGRIDAEIEPLRVDFARYEHARVAADPNVFGDVFGPLLGEVDIDGNSCGALSLVFEQPNDTADRFVVHRFIQATGQVDLGGYAVIWPPQS
jgi:hypothetical protein